MTSAFQQVQTPPQAFFETAINANFELLAHQAIYARDPLTTTGLTWGYKGGVWGGFAIAAGTLALAASTTNYVVVAVADGTISVATTTTHWNDSTNYRRVYEIVTGTSTVTGTPVDARGGPGGVHGSGGGTSTASKVIQIAASDEATAIATGGKVTLRAPYAMTLSAVRASLTTAQASGSIFTVDVKLNGTSIFSTLLTIDNTEKTSVTAATPAVLSTTAIADDDEITIFVTQVGASTVAAGLKLALLGS